MPQPNFQKILSDARDALELYGASRIGSAPGEIRAQNKARALKLISPFYSIGWNPDDGDKTVWPKKYKEQAANILDALTEVV